MRPGTVPALSPSARGTSNFPSGPYRVLVDGAVGSAPDPEATGRRWLSVGSSSLARGSVLPALALLLLVMFAYAPVVRCGFIWDDDVHVQANQALRTADGLRRIWFDLQATPQYYPLVHTTFWVEYQLWGLDARGYHVVNVLLHAASAVLLWRVLRRLELRGSWLAAAVFALHPVTVESVAWITERKNVLSGFLYLAAAALYLRHALQPIDARRARSYVGALLLFCGALLSKTVTCSLPAALVLVLWWKRGRLRRAEILPLLPFFALGLALGLLTVWLEKHHVGAKGELWDFSLVERFLIAGRAVWFYAGKVLYPVGLTFVYPRWEIDDTAWQAYLYPLAALGLVAALWLARRRIGRGPLAAVLFYGGTLLPALGFFDVYPMQFSFVADHFQYLAAAGLIAALVSVAVRASAQLGPLARRAGPLVALAVLATLGTLTWRQCPVYRDRETLWRDTVVKNPEAWMAQYGLANALLARGELTEAVGHYEAALRVRPDHSWAHNNFGLALSRLGDRVRGMEHYRRAVELDPDNAEARFNLANALVAEGALGEAIEQYRAGLATQPDAAQAHSLLAKALVSTGQLAEALEHLQEAVRLRPHSPEPLRRMAWIRATAAEPGLRDGSAAVRFAERAAGMSERPDAVVLDTLAAAYACAGRFEEAAAAATRAQELARSAGERDLAEEIGERARLYRAGTPYRE